MTEERPRPQYGEYATPEQQARAAGLSPADTKAAIQAAAAAHAAAATRAANAAHAAAPPPDEATRHAGAPPAASSLSVRHPIDRFFTIFLLGLGAFFLVTSIPNYLNFSDALATGYRQFGAGGFPEAALANSVGIWMLVAHSIVFVAAAVWSVRRLAAGKISSFVPVIGFLLFLVVFFVAFTVLFNAEPGYFQQISNTVFGT